MTPIDLREKIAAKLSTSRAACSWGEIRQHEPCSLSQGCANSLYAA